MRAAWLLLIPLAGFALLAFSSKKQKAPKFPGGPLPTPVIVSIPGFRRALQNEVTTPMEEAAVAAVASPAPLGTVVIREGFAVGLESHYDEARGWHRGASVFVKG